MQRCGTSDDDTQKRTALERVRDELIQDILSGYFPPGTRLTIAPLTQRYGTSATPIRAAIQELQGRGLVTVLAHSGARVRAIDADYIVNVYELRRAVLGIVIPRAVRFVSNADIEEIEALGTALEDALRAGGQRAVLEANRHFHRAVYRLARNPEALNVMEQTWLLVDALRMKFGFGAGRLSAMGPAHRAMIEALRQRETATAVTVFQSASDDAMEDLLELARAEKPAAEPAAPRPRRPQRRASQSEPTPSSAEPLDLSDQKP